LDDPSSERSSTVQGDDADVLPRPFTADQIRDEWVEGFELTVRRWTPDGEMRERWKVVAADADAAEIAFTPIDGDGKPVGEPRVERSTWVELRDHATFPADRATREQVTLPTALGELDGWLYTVHDPDDGTVSEYFFATRYPGAPVLMRVTQGEATLMVMEQLARSE